MPEYPDVEVYRRALTARIVGARLQRFGIAAAHLLRSVTPAPEALVGRAAERVQRIGKQIVLRFEDGYFCAIHLAVAGRFFWTPSPSASKPTRLSPRGNIAVWSFARTQAVSQAGTRPATRTGDLRLTERSRKKRAAIRLGRGEDQLRALDWGGLEVPGSTFEDFAARLTATNRTLKRALTEPARFSGIGNAYSDEILHRARLSPMKRGSGLKPEEARRLHAAAASVLEEWKEKLMRETGRRFPTGVTAFRPGMAVHGRYGQPCPDCDSIVRRVRRAENEFNYCPECQTGGRLLADRVMSRLLRRKWPRTVQAEAARRRALLEIPDPDGDG